MTQSARHTHRADGSAVLFKDARLVPRAAVIVGGTAIAASSVVGLGATSASADGGVWDRVAQCESGGRWSIATGNGYYGGLQFSRSTWNAFGGGQYASTANKASKSEQIAVAQRVLQAQGPGAWPVCSKRAGLTRSNGGASSAAEASAPQAETKQAAYSAPAQGSGSLAVDGKFGRATTRAMQDWAGVRQDGSLSRSDIRAIQSKVGATPDGKIGRETTRKVQEAVGMEPNGAKSFRTDRTTVRALQDHLNG